MLKVKEIESKEYDLKLSKKEDMFTCSECTSQYLGYSVIHTVHFNEGDQTGHICLDCYRQHAEDHGEE